MVKSGEELPDINALISMVIAAAKAELLPRFANEARQNIKHDGSVVTAADLAMQQRLHDELQNCWPAATMLAEEMPAAEQQQLFAKHRDGIWCLDPLDGTSNFAAGMPFFSVSLALIRAGYIELGIVYDPIRDECFSARRGHGALLNGQPLHCRVTSSPLSQTLANVDFKRLASVLAQRLVSDPPYRSQRSLGSVALDWCWLAANRFHLYLHGQQQVWDYAAGSLILHEAGGCSATLAGQPVWSNQLQPSSVVAAGDPALFKCWQEEIKRRGG